jgi:hypothetical protein
MPLDFNALGQGVQGFLTEEATKSLFHNAEKDINTPRAEGQSKTSYVAARAIPFVTAAIGGIIGAGESWNTTGAAAGAAAGFETGMEINKGVEWLREKVHHQDIHKHETNPPPTSTPGDVNTGDKPPNAPPSTSAPSSGTDPTRGATTNPWDNFTYTPPAVNVYLQGNHPQYKHEAKLHGRRPKLHHHRKRAKGH